jgi:aryl-alcohol dehydrogenase-like predicted oxidoreductase
MLKYGCTISVSMDYRNLGKSGLKVSQVCLGTNNFGGQVGEEASIEIVNKAVDCGINVLDTADVYTGGRSEEIIGKAVKGRRNDVVIATKVGFGVGQGPGQSGLSRKRILFQVEQSLRRLQTDFIDLYYLHRFDGETPLEETLRTFNDLVRQGKVRYTACSNFTAWQIAKAQEICEAHDWEKLVAVQPPYNLLQRDIEKDVLPYCQQEGLGVLTYTPLMGGFLTGKYTRATPPPAGSRFEFNSRLWQRVNAEPNFAVLGQIRSVAENLDVPMSKLAIAWILKNPVVTAPIVGASSTEQVEKNCQLIEIKIQDETYQKLNELTENVRVSLYS